MKKLPRRVVKPRNTVTRDITSKDKVATNLTIKPTILPIYSPPSTPRNNKRGTPRIIPKTKRKNIITDPKQPSIMDFVSKGKKRLNSIQLTPGETKKANNRVVKTTWENTVTNTRLVPTNRENTVKIVTEILRDIIYSEYYPIKIPTIFDHLKSKKPKVKKNQKTKPR